MATRIRREPPPFRPVEVVSVRDRSPRLIRIELAGPALEGMDPPGLAASIRVLLPATPGGEVELPTWNGNEFLARDGSRPPIRTVTPLAFDAAGPSLAVEVVRHGTGPLAAWAEAAAAGQRVALSGPGRGYDLDDAADRYLLAGDESALPAIGMLLEHIGPAVAVQVLVEIAEGTARLELPDHPRTEVDWLLAEPADPPGTALLEAVRRAQVDGAGTRIWAAGEAAGVQRIRRHLFEERGLSRAQATVRGYWKLGRGGDADA